MKVNRYILLIIILGALHFSTSARTTDCFIDLYNYALSKGIDDPNMIYNMCPKQVKHICPDAGFRELVGDVQYTAGEMLRVNRVKIEKLTQLIGRIREVAGGSFPKLCCSMELYDDDSLRIIVWPDGCPEEVEVNWIYRDGAWKKVEEPNSE